MAEMYKVMITTVCNPSLSGDSITGEYDGCWYENYDEAFVVLKEAETCDDIAVAWIETFITCQVVRIIGEVW